MTVEELLERVRLARPVSFQQTIAVISEFYAYTPTRFVNGLRNHQLVNEAGENEGSCRIFYFAGLHGLSREQTLTLFGEFYEQVKAHPNQATHQNIRIFSESGWEGIKFDGEVLSLNRR